MDIATYEKQAGPTELHKFYDYGDDAELNVIFIHGLGGHYQSTWLLESGASPWVRWIIEACPKVRVYSLGYRINVSMFGGGSMRIGARSINVLATIAPEINGTRRTIVICHSYGGLLAKQMLQTALDYTATYKDIAESIVGIVFMGTPHSGSSLANYANALKFVAPSEAISELKYNADQLLDLNKWFQNRIGKLKLQVLVFRESLKTHGVLVCDEATSNPNIVSVDPIPVDADHIDLPKPESRDVRVTATQAFIRQIAGLSHPQSPSPIQQIIAASDQSLPALLARFRADAAVRPNDRDLRQAIIYAEGLRAEVKTIDPVASISLARSVLSRTAIASRAFGIAGFGATVVVTSLALWPMLRDYSDQLIRNIGWEESNHTAPTDTDQSSSSVATVTRFPMPVAVIGRDGSGAKSGEMTMIDIKLMYEPEGSKSDQYEANWIWSGSGGTQGGSQMAVVELVGSGGPVLQTLKFPIKRDHCYYSPGVQQSFSGALSVPAISVKSLRIFISPVVGKQGPC